MPTGRVTGQSLFKVVTHTSAERSFAVRLPADAKPLHATVETNGRCRAGLVASFYNPAAHAWVVRQAYFHDGQHGGTAAELTVSVIVMMDPGNAYELQVRVAKLVDTATHNDEHFALKQRSLLYKSALSGSDGEAARHVATVLPRAAQVVTVVCPVGESQDGELSREATYGFVLCGGGFVSDYPVVASGPAWPETMQDKCTRLLGLPRVNAIDARDAALGQRSVRTAAPESAVEWRAWQVSAAANAGLACFAMSLRRRPQSPLFAGVLTSRSPRATRGIDVTGLVPSLNSSCAAAGTGTISSLVAEAYQENQVTVRMTAVGEKLDVVLPPPHGSFTASLASQRPLYRAAHENFYASE